MHIHRFDNVGSPGANRTVRNAGAKAGDSVSGAAFRENDAEGVVGGDELDSLTRQLDEISDVRPGVVEAAKVRVQRGDYLTRAAAEKTADAILNRDV